MAFSVVTFIAGVKGYLLLRLFNSTQTGLHWRKLDSGLLQYPRFNLDVPQVQQVEFPLDVVLFSNRARLVPHNLRHDTGKHFHPFRQRVKGTAQTCRESAGRAAAVNALL